MSDHLGSDVLAVRVERSGSRREIWLDGELDGGEVRRLQRLLDDAGAGEQVVVRAGGLSFIDSMGLRLVVEWHRRLEELDGRLVVREPSDALRRLLAVTGLDEVVHVEHTPPDP